MTSVKRQLAVLGVAVALGAGVVGPQVGHSVSQRQAGGYFTYTGFDYPNRDSCDFYGQLGQDEGYWTLWQCRGVSSIYQLWVHYV